MAQRPGGTCGQAPPVNPGSKSILRGKRYNATKQERGGDRKSMYQNDTSIPTREALADKSFHTCGNFYRPGRTMRQLAQCRNHKPPVNLAKIRVKPFHLYFQPSI